MQTHLAPRTLKSEQAKGENVEALFSAQPNRKAVLFIHGFSGNALRTWSEFPELLPECSKCTGSDLYFYGYDALRDELIASAAIFRVFLDRLFGKTKEILAANLPPSAQRADDFEYDQLVIAAHSLGAVVARRALLDATIKQSGWVARTKLVLFAPAHMGARVADLALEAASSFSFVKLFGHIIRFASPFIDELKPNSPELKSLLADTTAALEGGKNAHLVAQKVIIATRESIVSNIPFAKDPPPDAIAGTSHTTVCKPRKNFLQPFTYLEECL
jgi:pimeloyl-ACP methyl ester carboxylesterase